MAVKIRLARAGSKKHPYYHVVATESTNPRDGRFIEALGAYDPVVTPVKIELDHERLDHWIKNGAVVTETVAGLIKRHKKAQAAAAPKA
jgi:small subunit ribosomal protein S16